jgi:hypothetical protein
VRGRLQRGFDRGPNAIEILQHVVIPETKHVETLTLQVRGSGRVALNRMLAAINFDNQASLGTQKVNDISIDLHLATESKTRELAITKDAPQIALGVGRILAKRSCFAGQMMWSCQNAPSPRRCRADPLPQRGEGFNGTVNA